MKSRRSLFGFLIFAAFLPAILLGCQPSPQQMEKAIGDYFAKNPPALQKALGDAMKAQRPQRPPEMPLEEKIKRAIKVDVGNSPSKGPANAPITIVEFSDFQCPFCSRVVPTVKQIMDEYPGKVRFVFRNNPLPFHQNAASAAKAAQAAKDQGKFWEMHDALFENQKDLSDEGIRQIAKKVGLNMAKFEKDWKSTKYDEEISQDMNFARSNGATGTPAFFINGVLVTGAQPIQGFKVVIDKLLEGPPKS